MRFATRNVLVAVGLSIATTLVQLGCSKPESGPGAETGAPGSAATSPAPAKPQPRSVTLQEGTAVKVRTTTAISTKSHQSGDAFTASLEEPLMNGDRVIAPKGARVEGQVAEADPGGRVQGRAHLAIRLTRLHTADNQVIEISTNTIAREARATKGKDAAKIGIGSGVGAAIGAIAGGGKGAAIGAAAGAGAGTGAVLATRGEPAVIPNESVLNFKLRAPVTVK